MDLSAERPWWPLGDLDQMGDAVRYWIGQNWSLDLTVRAWWHRLAVAGLTAPTWPRAHGGLATTTVVQRVIEHELASARTVAPPVDHDGFRVVATALRQFGTSTQLEAWLPDLLCGVTTWGLLVDEQGVDDTVHITTGATFDWKYIALSGSKHLATTVPLTHALVLARSGDLGRAGLTFLAVDLATDGVRVGGDTVTFDDVRLTDDAVLGRRDRGWAVWTATRPYLERSLAGRIRRGLARALPGEPAGDLDRTVGDILEQHVPPAAPEVDRRGG